MSPPGPDRRPGPAAEEDRAEDELLGGLNPVLAALKSRPRACRSVLVAEGRHSEPRLREIMSLARAAGVAVRSGPRSALDRLFGRDKHQGVLARFEAQEYLSLDDFLLTLPETGPCLVLALDRVEDPGNLGALMRSALAFGAAGVIIPRERSAPLTAAARRAAAGAADILPLGRAVNLRRALEALRDKGFWLLGADGGEERTALFDFAFPERSVIVLGSEGRGLSPMIQKTCDALLAIPQARREVSSLNVSVAGAVFMSEYCRQRRGR